MLCTGQYYSGQYIKLEKVSKTFLFKSSNKDRRIVIRLPNAEKSWCIILSSSSGGSINDYYEIQLSCILSYHYRTMSVVVVLSYDVLYTSTKYYIYIAHIWIILYFFVSYCTWNARRSYIVSSHFLLSLECCYDGVVFRVVGGQYLVPGSTRYWGIGLNNVEQSNNFLALSNNIASILLTGRS